MSMSVVTGLFMILVGAYGADLSPPSITAQPRKQVYFNPGKVVTLKCEAEGEPQPSYSWLRNGEEFRFSRNDDKLFQVPGHGTLMFMRPEKKDEGFYQCIATNNFGASASVITELRMTTLEPFPAEAPITYRPQLGDALTLPCFPPLSVPKPAVFWAILLHDGRFEVIEYNARVTMDGEYNLRFAHVTLEDTANGNAYICIAMNTIARKSERGVSHFIEPMGTTQVARSAQYMWSSPAESRAMRGEKLTLQCIFSGSPTPDVSWSRDDADISSSSNRSTSYTSLTFHNLQYEDGGEYSCSGYNSMTREPLRRSFRIVVVSKPYFPDGEEPKDHEVTVGSDVVFECNATGTPKPKIEWFINTVPFKLLEEGVEVKDPRVGDRLVQVSPHRLALYNAQVTDLMVVQCNASNVHGYVFSDVYLNVFPTATDSHFPDYNHGASTLYSRDLTRPCLVLLTTIACLVYFGDFAW